MTTEELEIEVETIIINERLNDLKGFHLKELPGIVREYRNSIMVGINNQSKRSKRKRTFWGLDILICLDILYLLDEDDLLGEDRIDPISAFLFYAVDTEEGELEMDKFNKLKVSGQCHIRLAKIIENYYKDNCEKEKLK